MSCEEHAHFTKYICPDAWQEFRCALVFLLALCAFGGYSDAERMASGNAAIEVLPADSTEPAFSFGTPYSAPGSLPTRSGSLPRTSGAVVTRDLKSCNLAVPVDFQSSGSHGQFDAEYYFAGQRGPVSSDKYPQGTDKDLFSLHEVGVSPFVWTPCEASTNFRVNSAITAVKTASAKEETHIAIDSVDSTV
ncbi:hypothetical protein GN244_ATG18537 [Phytophthora infestans]|uniref:Uncharacterized protein n=1 Tax=Phytophthora infestans TaxID=4787 RepID=A0A833WJZ7_PHYIN|nr:hypothetical protein GN244_ATG18537 [Phytophthora infestans]